MVYSSLFLFSFIESPKYTLGVEEEMKGYACFMSSSGIESRFGTPWSSDMSCKKKQRKEKNELEEVIYFFKQRRNKRKKMAAN
ncbi:hypothetical protein A4A49_26160 [Nicotiana attenuata]|uniref:Uncharacterized protein n=1 Tax=Nicotiana attenuata TaxID=49451 RepID=A0A314KMK4_NICAT|nr:hypothetical protein A4A49_26160 [Nicotiana attenuata]